MFIWTFFLFSAIESASERLPCNFESSCVYILFFVKHHIFNTLIVTILCLWCWVFILLQVNSTLSSRISFPTYFRGSELVVVGKLYNTGAEQTESINAGELIARTSNGTTIYPIVIGGCCHCLPIPPVPTVRNEPSKAHYCNFNPHFTLLMALDMFSPLYVDSCPDCTHDFGRRHLSLSLSLHNIYMRCV